MITTTLGKLIAAANSQAIAHVSDLIPPGRYQFRVAKLLDAIDAELTGFNKQNQALIRKYYVPDEKGGYTLVGAPLGNAFAFGMAMDELLTTEIKLDHDPISWSKLGPTAEEKLTINDVRALGALLVDDTES